MTKAVAHINLDAPNTLIIPGNKTLRLRIPSLMKKSQPVRCRLVVGEQALESCLDEQQQVTFQLEPALQSGSALLQVWHLGEEHDCCEWDLLLGELPSIGVLQGAQARLHNLGYEVGAVDGVWGERTAQALCLFRQRHRISVPADATTSSKGAALRQQQLLDQSAQTALQQAHGS